VESVEGLKTADIVDAMGRLHRHRCHILDLVTPTPGRVLFGPAVTISYFPSCSAALDPERYNLSNLFYEAVGDEREDRLLRLVISFFEQRIFGPIRIERLEKQLRANAREQRKKGKLAGTRMRQQSHRPGVRVRGWTLEEQVRGPRTHFRSERSD
jgi:hypothetical protein